jgi:hypothetical protein
MEAKLLEGLKRAIAALNMKTNFQTNEGIRSYTLLAELDGLVKKAEEKVSETAK